MGAALSGFPLPLANMTSLRSYVYIGNLVAAIEHGIIAGLRGKYNVTDNEDVSLRDLVGLMARSAGKRARLFAVPSPLLKLVMRIMGPGRFEKISGEFILSSARLCATGYVPPYGLEQGIRATVASGADGE